MARKPHEQPLSAMAESRAAVEELLTPPFYELRPPSTPEEAQQFEAARRQLAKAFRPFVAEYRALVRKLRGEGFRISSYTMMAPVQLQGRLPSGERFYFRCRHETCSLRIAPPKGNPVTTPAWTAEVSRWEWPYAGALTAPEAEAVLRELLAGYTKGE